MVLDDWETYMEERGKNADQTEVYLGTGDALEDAGYVLDRNDGTGLTLDVTIDAQQTSLFDDIKVAERVTTIDLASSFGTSELRDIIESSGTGDLSPDPDPDTGEFVLTTGSTAGSDVKLESAETGRYTPGHSAEVGIGIRQNPEVNPDFAGTARARWGYYSPGGDGFLFGQDENPDTGEQELYTAILEGGTEVMKTYRSNWNGVDSLDAQLGRTVDLLDEGAIFQINFAWYGYGIIEYSVVTNNANNEQVTTILHRQVRNGRTSIADPNERITVEVRNGDQAQDYDLRVGGRQFSIVGSVPSEERITPHTRENVSVGTGSYTYLMAWKRESGSFNSRFNIASIDALQNGNTRYALHFVNPEFEPTATTGQSFGVPTGVKEQETLLEVDTAGSWDNISQANLVWEGLASGSSSTSGSLDTGDLSTNLPQDGELVLSARGVGNSRTVNAVTMRMLEDW